MVSVIGESSVGSGSRRIEALVGIEAFRAFATERALVARLSDMLKAPKDQLEERLASTVEELKAAQRKLAALQTGQLATRIPELLNSAVSVGQTKFVSADLGDLGSIDDLRTIAVALRDKVANESSIIAVFGTIDSKPMTVIATTSASRDFGFKAGALVRVASSVLGGGGGGKDDMAQGGGSDSAKIADAISAIKEALSA